MSLLDAVAARLADLRLRPKRNTPLSRRGWWRLGGPADLYVELPSPDALAATLALAHEHSLPITVLGNGSNLLVADAGVRGIVVKLTGDFRTSTLQDGPQGPEVVAGGGLYDAVLLKRLDDAGVSGLGCLAGVPGTVGGAVRMNAGTHLGELGDRVREVEVALPDGTLARLTPADIRFSYRRAHLPAGAIVTRAWLRIETDPTTVASDREKVRHHLDRRKATQPLDQPSCGSTFKNPTGDAAGRLIDISGLKGHRIGGAQISEKHANFIVNTGGATAMNVYDLICLARRTVHDQHGVALEPEVHAIGDWPEGSWPLHSLS